MASRTVCPRVGSLVLPYMWVGRFLLTAQLYAGACANLGLGMYETPQHSLRTSARPESMATYDIAHTPTPQGALGGGAPTGEYSTAYTPRAYTLTRDEDREEALMI